MGQSLVKNYVHLVFSTKHRQPLILPSVEAELHSYLGGTCRRLECPVIKVGSHFDHVHILCMLSKKMTITSLLEELKSSSSKWMKSKGREYQTFYWQNGYGSFSVGAFEIDNLITYIANQHDHHRKVSFQDEFRGYLETYDIEYDERYVWD